MTIYEVLRVKPSSRSISIRRRCWDCENADVHYVICDRFGTWGANSEEPYVLDYDELTADDWEECKSEPMKMSVWEWRNYPDVMFQISKDTLQKLYIGGVALNDVGDRYKWDKGILLFSNSSHLVVPFTGKIETWFLESEGIEIIE